MNTSFPLVLCLSGLDPTGGAGIQADIEAVAAGGGHALPIVTTLTVQDSRNVFASVPVAAEILASQIDAVLADCEVSAVKIGLLGDAGQTRLIAERLSVLRIPVVCDPVLRAGGGTDMANEERIIELRTTLLPLVTVLTPNASEARRLVPDARNSAEAARRLLDLGCRNVLVTGGDEPGDGVTNYWFSVDAAPKHYQWPRLAETFHGAGCTLASAIAVRLALGADLGHAIVQAQQWTHSTLQRAFSVGRGRRIPDRKPHLRP